MVLFRVFPPQSQPIMQFQKITSMDTFIVATGALAQNNSKNGFASNNGSFIYAAQSESRNNGEHGYNAWSGSRIYAHEAIATNNSGVGFRAADVSSIHSYKGAANSNQQGNYSPKRYTISHDNSYIN